jgi:uncharacterized membrane protein
MENAGAEIILVVILGIVWFTTKNFSRKTKADSGSRKLAIHNFVTKILLSMYAFFGFDYVVLVAHGLSQFSKDS